MNMMKAIVVEQSGSPEVLHIRQIHRPKPDNGWVLVRIRAFGLNRSEMFTRQGFSPDVTFPRILGIEAVGEVEQDPSGHYQAGQKVAAVMGGMGRQYNGGYAEYAVLPLERLMPLQTTVSWEILGAIPEMFLTVWSSLTESLDIQAGQTLLVPIMSLSMTGTSRKKCGQFSRREWIAFKNWLGREHCLIPCKPRHQKALSV